MTSALVVAVVLWPACWYAISRRLRRHRRRSPARQLAAVLAYDVLTWALAIALLASLSRMDAWLSAPPAVELLLAALAGAALYAALAGRSCRGTLRGLRPSRRVATQGIVFALTATAEEVIFRGFLLAALAVEFGVPAGVAVLAAAGVFALMHVDAHGRRAVVTHLLTGCVFGAVFVATGSVAAAAACHLAYNLGVLGAHGAKAKARRTR